MGKQGKHPSDNDKLRVGRGDAERRNAAEQISRQTAVLQAINDVFQKALTCETEEELGKTCLTVAEQLTGSKFGFIGELNQRGTYDTIAISNPGWDACKMPESEATRLLMNMPLRGIWTRPLKDGKSLMLADPSSHPDSVGTPEGHPPITSFLGVPLKHKDRTFGMFALGNKEGGYDVADKEAAESLSVAIVEALRSKRAEEALRAANQQLRASEQQLRAANQQLTASEQQLRAANQQLTASEQQLRAANQQLTASEQQLRAANQQLTASEQQLRAANQQLQANEQQLRAANQQLHAEIAERKKAEKEILDYQAQLKSLASQLTLAEESERHRIATELHATIGQSLAVSKLQLDTLRASVASGDIAGTLGEVSNSLDETIQDTKSLTFDLSSPILYELGFERAVAEWLAEQVQQKHRIATEFEDDKQPKPLDDDVRVFLFRDVRELLINVVKHAQAKKVKVSICRVGGNIQVSVEDDGWGFNPEKVAATATSKGGFGLFSIRQRLEQLRGHLEIESAPGHGTRVTIIAPLKQASINNRGQK